MGAPRSRGHSLASSTSEENIWKKLEEHPITIQGKFQGPPIVGLRATHITP